jgi:hypothetical protein
MRGKMVVITTSFATAILQSTAAGAATADAHFLGTILRQQLHPRDSMAQVKLGIWKFDVDCECIDVRDDVVTDAECVALAARMKSGEMRRLKELILVSLFSVVFVVFVEFLPSRPLIRIISQHGNGIGADGARAIADAMRTNSSVQYLSLVRLCCR